MWVEQIRAAQFTIGYEFFSGTALASRARSVCVPFNLEQGYPRRISPEEKAFLTKWTDEA
jgi:acyl-CoA thioester hydrolase